MLEIVNEDNYQKAGNNNKKQEKNNIFERKRTGMKNEIKNRNEQKTRQQFN